MEEIGYWGANAYVEKHKNDPIEYMINLDVCGAGNTIVFGNRDSLGYDNPIHHTLKKVCVEGKLRDLEGFGEITERNIIRGIQLKEKTSGRVFLNVAYEDGEAYLKYLKNCDKVRKLSVAGSLRRRKETIGDLDILASSDKPDEVMEYFVNYNDVQRVLLQGSTKTSVLLTDNLQVDLRVVKNESFGVF